MRNVRRIKNRIQTSFRRFLDLYEKRAMYGRLLRLEALEARTLMAADCLVSQEHFDSAGLMAEGEAPAPVIGYMPPEPPDLANSKPWRGPGFGEPILPANTFLLHSRPSAKKTIYLDFDGFTARGTTWNTSNNITTIVSPAWDPDRNGPAFTNNELLEIQGAWQRVATDYAPFDVDVTTEDPGEANLVNTGGTDDRWGIRVVVTLTDFSNSGAGGFAFIGSFHWDYESNGATDTPCYVFTSTAMSVAAASSHEVGHSVGLSHDGTTAANPFQQNAEYYDGHGNGENSWGPIMGSGYYRNVTTWDDGTYFGTSNGTAGSNYGTGPKDLSTITQASNGFGFVPDADGNTDTSATTLVGTSIPGGRQSISKFATIEQPTDVDFFKFQTGTGIVDITIDPYVTDLWTSDGNGGYVNTIESAFFDGTRWNENQGSNLDVQATLYDAVGNVIAVSDPAGLRASFSNLSLRVGTYYIKVDGVGFGDPKANPPSGYSDYGSLGHYQIKGTIASSIEIAISDVSNYTENTPPIPIASDATFTTFNIDTFAGGTLQFAIGTNYQVGDQLRLASLGAGPGQISVAGSDIFYGGVLIGTVSIGVQNLSVNFNAAATSGSLQAVIRALTFEHTTDAPTTAQRLVSVFLDNADNGASNVAFAKVGVIPVNDSPVLSDASLQSIAEDTTNSPGQQVLELVGAAFRDVDIGSSLSGIAITTNTASSGTGIWQYSINSVQWAPIGTVSSSSSLLLSKDTWIRFLPALNFNGAPAPLRFRGLDDTFAGTFSTRTVRSTINVTSAVPNGPLSLSDSSLRTLVTPVNDAPVSLVSSPAFESYEDEFYSLVIPTNAWFSDVDDTVFQLSLNRTNGQPFPSWLTFDPVAGRLSGLPNNDQVGNYEFAVTAFDSFKASAVVTFTLSILNVNDAPTAINLIGDSVSENVSGVSVGTLFGTDPDAADTLVFSMVNVDTRFAISGNQLFVVSGRSLDYEQTPFVDLTIRATDSGTPSLFLDQLFRIRVLDVNEFAPALRATVFHLPENSPGLTTVGSLQAPDRDHDDQVKYRFVGTPPELFTIDANTGRIAVKASAALDYEIRDSYQFFVEAYDDGTPPLATASSVLVVLDDVNEFAPTIDSNAIFVSEKQTPNVAFAKVQASDLDTKQKLTFSLPQTENRFHIDPSTGELALTRLGIFDFEQSSVSSVVVRVTDTGGRFGDKTLIVNVTDANDPPTSAMVATTQVLSNVTDLDIGLISIADQDVGQTYTIQSLDDRFSVKDGRLVLASGKALSETDPLSITVPIVATEVGLNPASFQLSVGLTRIANPKPWQNRSNALNVDRSKPEEGNLVDPRDVLVIINSINSKQQGKLPFPRPASTLGQSDLDADGDGFLTPLDVLVIVNFLNGASSNGEGESSTSMSIQPSVAPMADSHFEREKESATIWLAAYQQLEEEIVRRRRG
jgi:Cadherin domain/Putative Ig domain/Metallo-peptidase family M12B Reprolysin-like